VTGVAQKPVTGNPLERLVKVRHGEWKRLSLAFSYFFFLLGSYFMLRPIRGTIAANNSDHLQWLYTATFVSMLLLVPVFGFLVSRFRRSRFIPGIYLFFICNLLLFIAAFDDDATRVWIQRGFYVWLSVFNLFVVSIFWSFMVDIFRPGQAQRLFGTIMAGGSIGAMVGSSVTAQFVADWGSRGVMSISAAGLLIATALAVRLGWSVRREHQDKPAKIIGGTILEGAARVFRSPYLLLICLLMLTHNLTSTFLYNGLAVLVDQNLDGFRVRTEFYGTVDLVVQVIAFLLQFLVTSRLVIHLGMPRTAVLVPAILAAGFVILGNSLGLVMFAAVGVLQRSMNYGVLGPVKEMLFTVVDRDSKYKSKNFIDTVIYRGSDVTASWVFKGLMTAGFSIGQMVWLFLPVLGLWGWGAWTLGRSYERLNGQAGTDESSG
jgi:AAA family ATP:ADP antiporter